tara:strand:- start:8914 stop:10749 length:1836 start_codon:yes stop_codon:yes gene_type:complete
MFSRDQINKIATHLGYEGPMSQFSKFLASDPALQRRYFSIQNYYKDKVLEASKGAYVKKYQTGGSVEDEEDNPNFIGNQMAKNIKNPEFAEGAKLNANNVANNEQVTSGKTDITTGTGEVSGDITTDTSTVKNTETVTAPETTGANTYEAETSSGNVDDTLNKDKAVEGKVSDAALMDAQTQDPESTALAGQTAAQGEATQIEKAANRELQQGELIDGSAVDQDKVDNLADQTMKSAVDVREVQADFMKDFEGGNVPIWANDAMLQARQELAARGLSASSIAGQSIIQAMMKSSLPLVEMQVGNKQQMAVEASKQRANFLNLEFTQDFEARVKNAARISEIADMNFTAEQQVILENAKMAETMNLQNLTNKQAVKMAEIAQIAALETTNLNNRQLAAQQNAQAFLDMDMKNVDNAQAKVMFDAASRIQALFDDTAAANAAKQFNATSQNQTDQFFAELKSATEQYNATQKNATAQFNSGQENAMAQFNAETKNNRDQFNANNQLVIAQSNAQWRREIATADTAAQNFANQRNADALLDISTTASNNMWQYHRDSMEWAWTSAENERGRQVNMAISELNAKTQTDMAQTKLDWETSKSWGGWIFSVLSGGKL